jgi:hypothetical protein
LLDAIFHAGILRVITRKDKSCKNNSL